MASDNNRFSQTEGGAMLTPNNKAQPSFDNSKLHEHEMQRMAPTQGQEQNAEDAANENTGSELDENGEKKGNLEEKAAKEGAKLALEAAGVPAPAAKEIVDKAEADGTIAKLVGMIKKKKMAIVAGIISALSPIFLILVHFLLIGILIIGAIGVIVDRFGFIINLLTFDGEAVAEFLDEAGTNLISGTYLFQTYLSVSLPNYGYVDGQTESLSGDALETTRKDEIERLSKINAAILSPAYTYQTSYFGDNEMRISDVFDGLTFDSIDGFLSSVATIKDRLPDFFNQGDIFRQTAEDACILAFAGLSKDGQSYFQYRNGNTTAELTNSDYTNVVAKLDAEECKDTKGFGGKFNDTNVIRSLDFSSFEKFIDSISKLPANIYTDIIENQKNPLNDVLKDKIDDYQFDEATYRKFLETYYYELRYGSLIKDNDGNATPEIKSDFIDDTISQLGLYESLASDGLKQHYENSSGSGFEETVIDSLGSIYGESKCAVLEEYNPLTHEYVVSKSIDDDEIHSVSDGEVVEVIYSGENIYSKYDSKSGKCLCDGAECENSNGSQIKIKFTYDEVEYMAIYSNLAEIRVDVGDQVKKGDVIATEGNSGCTNTKKTTFKLISENGISYNTNELVQNCSSYTNTVNLCNFQNIKVNLHSCENDLIKTIPFYDYIKEELHNNFKNGINNEEFLKAATLITVTKILRDNNYMIGTTEIDIQKCNYIEAKISEKEYEKMDKAVSSVMGQVITYSNKFANVKYSNTCTRTEKDKNANAVYNELCVTEAIKLDKTYKEILRIYYPGFYVNENYCTDYASKVNAYSINNNKSYLIKESYSNEEIARINTNIKRKVDEARIGTRAAAVEAARYLALGLKYKIPYKNGGKYFEEGFNINWYDDGLDSSGFVSWVLKNGGGNIEKNMTSNELISNNVVGNLKITAELYKYYDKIQVGDFAYNDSRIGIIIGKSDGILYVAEANIDSGLIVTKIASYGESDSKYTHIYFADDYYNGVGNITSMW